MSEVLVLVDHVDGKVTKPTLELLTIARRLGEPSAVFIGDASAAAETLGKFGAVTTWLRERTGDMPVWWAEWYFVPEDKTTWPEPMRLIATKSFTGWYARFGRRFGEIAISPFAPSAIVLLSGRTDRLNGQRSEIPSPKTRNPKALPSESAGGEITITSTIPSFSALNRARSAPNARIFISFSGSIPKRRKV